ncbi:MAG: ABC transporter permease [Bacillota bacterium]|jgi:ABC-2 type transport system permease protein|nr:ABC transporter permease [Bacillota bacterium]NLL60795.1 ABC transporter permease [Tissierellia bacterium]
MKVLRIIVKDLKIVLSDRQALIITLLMPLVLMTILSMALKGSFMSSDDTGMEKIPVALVKQYDKGADSEIFVKTLEERLKINISGDEVNPEEMFFDDFLGNPEVSKLIDYRVEEENRAKDLLNEGEISAIIILPDKYIYDMKISLLTPFRNNADLKVLTHPDRPVAGEIVTSLMEAYTNTMSSVIIGKNVLIESASANDIGGDGFDNIDEIMEGMADLVAGTNVNIDNVTVEGRRSIKSSEYYAAAMMTMFLLFAAGQGGRMLLEEKDNQTYQRMVIADISKTHILAGKFIVIFLIASLQIFIMLAYSHFALKVKWGNMIPILVLSTASAFSVAGLGIFIASLTYRAGNYRLANAFENVIIQVMAFVGGSFFPIDVMPEVIRRMSFISLNGVALKAYLKIIVGYNLADILKHVSILAITGILLTLIGVVIFNKGVSENA